MKYVLLTLVGVTLLLIAGGVTYSPQGEYMFVPGPAATKLAIAWGQVVIPPLSDEEWVIVAGSEGYLDSIFQVVGSWDKCYLVEIKGPTEKVHIVRAGLLGMNYISIESTSFRSSASFDQKADNAQSIWSGLSFCKGGLDVWLINGQT